MTNYHFPPNIASIANTDKVDSYDVLLLRRDVFGDDKIGPQEADHLFALDLAVSEKCREWGQFFSEAIVDYIIHKVQPVGIVSKENAEWLIDQISDQGLVKSPEQMELLVKVLELAKSAPDFLAKFALEQVSHAVLNNQGPVAEGRDGTTCVICKSDVEIIRRLMYGFASEGGLAVSKAEAEFLFDLNDKTIEDENDSAWNDLFMRAVGNYLLFSMKNAVPERRIALAEEVRRQPEGAGIGYMVDRLRSVFQALPKNYRKEEEYYRRASADYETGLVDGAVVTSSEAAWVAERICSDGVMHENEKALLRFLKEESPNVHSSLQELVNQAA